MGQIDRSRLAAALERERERFASARPRSAAAASEAADHLIGGVPMTWMAKWAGGFPVFLDGAAGSRVTDIDGHTYVDFALGDTGAMAGPLAAGDGRGHPTPPRGQGRRHRDAPHRGCRVGGPLS